MTSFCDLGASSATMNCSLRAIYNYYQTVRSGNEGDTHDELDNGVVESLVLHVASLLDEVKQFVQKGVVKYP
jgi:hypothetical protein